MAVSEWHPSLHPAHHGGSGTITGGAHKNSSKASTSELVKCVNSTPYTSHIFSHLHAHILVSHRHWLKVWRAQPSSSCAHVVCLILRDSPFLFHSLSYRLFHLPGLQLLLPRCGGQIPCALSLKDIGTLADPFTLS